MTLNKLSGNILKIWFSIITLIFLLSITKIVVQFLKEWVKLMPRYGAPSQYTCNLLANFSWETDVPRYAWSDKRLRILSFCCSFVSSLPWGLVEALVVVVVLGCGFLLTSSLSLALEGLGILLLSVDAFENSKCVCAPKLSQQEICNFWNYNLYRGYGY